MKDYIVCRKNGRGEIFSEGGIAGIWSYVCQDPTIEAVQIKCQGREDKWCEVIQLFPWLPRWEEIYFTMFRRMFSGVIQVLLERE